MHIRLGLPGILLKNSSLSHKNHVLQVSQSKDCRAIVFSVIYRRAQVYLRYEGYLYTHNPKFLNTIIPSTIQILYLEQQIIRHINLIFKANNY